MHSLSVKHRVELETGSAISPEIIAERDYFTATRAHELPAAFADYQCRPGLVIPILDITGKVVGWHLKADAPRRNKDGKPLKYDTAKDGRQCLDISLRVLPLLGDPSVPLWITEGEKKVDSGLSHRIPCIIGVLGVWSWRGTNELGGKIALADWEGIALDGRVVVLAFDSDVVTKASVQAALNRLSAFLKLRGAEVRYLVLPSTPDGTKCGLDDAFACGMQLAEVERHIVPHLPDSEPEWEQPTPLDDPTGPPFPLGALPGIVVEFVTAVAEEIQTPPDLAAIVALGTLSAAAGGKYEVVIPEQGWSEPVHIQAVAVAEPGTRKSGIFRRMTVPIVAYERDVQPDECRALAQWESGDRSLVKALASAENAASKPREGTLTDTEAVHMSAVGALEAHKAKRPRITRIITDDATPEAVKTLLAEQGGAIAAMSAENAFLSNTAGGRYSDAPNLDVLLNGHAGDSIRVDRKGKPSEIVDRTCLTLCLMVQPQVIRDLGKSPGFIARGGAARLLTCFPEDILDHRRIDVTPVAPALSTAWSRTVTAIVSRTPSLQDGAYVPWSLALAADALHTFRAYHTQHEPRMAREGALGDIRDWGGKQCGAVSQHDFPERVPISAHTLRQAITIVTYFEQHARVMYRLMHGRSEHGDARTVFAALQRLGTPTTRRDLHRLLQNCTGFASARGLDAPLSVLEEHGFIKKPERRSGDKGGRPSEPIHLNPLIMDDKTDTTSMQHQAGGDSVSFVSPFQRQPVVATIRDESPSATGTDDYFEEEI